MTLGQKIKKLRVENGLTQKDLADKVYVTFQTVSKWENDENEPDVSTLRELARLFDCTMDYLLSEDDKEKEKQEAPKEPLPPVETVTKTIIIHQHALHVCAKCNKDIPENDLEVEHLTRTERHGRTSRTVPAGESYYHKECYAEILKKRAEDAAKIKAAKASRTKKLSFGWGIAGGAIAFTIALLIFLLVPALKERIHPALSVLFATLIGYAIFAMLYCIITGSYLGEVFAWCAGLSIKFPGLIFSWDLGGFAWLIAMKILFAALGFLVGVAALLFAIVLSASLGAFSFPFVLVHNINTDYQDGF